MSKRGYVGGKRVGSKTTCGLHPRAKVIAREGNKLTYLFPCGHKRTEVFMQGPAGAKRPAPIEVVTLFARYWAQGVSYQCPRCLRKEKAAGRNINGGSR